MVIEVLKKPLALTTVVPSTIGGPPRVEMRMVTVSPGEPIPVMVTTWPGNACGTLIARSCGV